MKPRKRCLSPYRAGYGTRRELLQTAPFRYADLPCVINAILCRYNHRYKIKIIQKIRHGSRTRAHPIPPDDTHVLDSLGRNAAELDKIRTRMAGLIGQREFFVDNIVLTASASQKAVMPNNTLAQGQSPCSQRLPAQMYRPPSRYTYARYIGSQRRLARADNPYPQRREPTAPRRNT